MTDRTLNLFMYLNLQKQAYEWMYALPPFTQKTKQIANIAKAANERLIKQLENEIGEQNSETYWDISEKFSKALEMIIKAETEEKKWELIELLMAWSSGDVKVIENIDKDQEKDVRKQA